ncbi:MAG TPA: hypothetical protein VF384_14170 [Planctomycetota bacterium]
MNAGAVPVQEARSTLVGGPGMPPGTPVVGPLAAAALFGLDGVTPAIARGTTWTVRYRSASATPVLTLFSDKLSASVLPLLSDPAWLPLAGFAVLGAGITGANGVVPFAVAVPNTPALLHAPFFVQAVAGAALPLEAAPPVGGVLR